MSDFNKSFKSNPSDFRYTISFKASWMQHNQLLEYSTKTGMNISEACREIFDAGLDKINEIAGNRLDKAKVHLFGKAKEVREHKHLLQTLAELQSSLSQGEFETHCQELGIDPLEVENETPPGGVNTKDERAKAFLRVLFTDRPEGLPAKRVLEIAAQEGFGQNLTRHAANQMGIRFVSVNTLEGRVYIWKPPETG